MRLAYANYFDDYTITATTENANYPATNLQDARLSKVWRSTALSNQYLTIDSGATLTPTCVFIYNHNLTSGATIKIQGSSDNFSSTTTDETIVYTSDVCYKFFTTTALRYWRIKLTDAANTDGYLRAGRIWLGVSTSLATPANQIALNYIDTTVSTRSYSGQHYANEGYTFKNYILNFPYLSVTDTSSIITFNNAVKKEKTFVFTLSTSTNTLADHPPLYAYMETGLNLTHVVKGAHSAQLNLMEAK